MTLQATVRPQTDGEVIRTVCACLTVLIAFSAASAADSALDTGSAQMAVVNGVAVDAIGHDFDGKRDPASKWLTVGDAAKQSLALLPDDVESSEDFRLFHLQSSGRAPLLISDVARTTALAKSADFERGGPVRPQEAA